jgi:hypothetical protein
VEKCAKFLFWSKVEAACGLETVITVIAVIGSPFYTDHMDDSASLGFFPAYLRPCAMLRPPSGQIGTASQR